ncbi:phosphodiesterase [Ferrimonas lipolytica]|uniref:Phosphoesterase n=1 Tax=Ferrimonas lipolytica TaxID=2724191 RepID=A0A6H1UDT2_9GAMM|nr:phosphodiesterase [Ferrimonas lipolytica]QIZ76376.1 phosphodiesterase [Ferrimonas lipolytica]
MLFIADIHGSLPALESALRWQKKLQASTLVILGDVLNHGPRNPLPAGYDPQGVAALLNQRADNIIAIRGNCDSEVDQMLCDFPLLAEYNWLVLNGRRLCLTHGHLLGPNNLPPLKAGEGIAYGHTHLPIAQWQEDRLHFNPGSISSPKGGNVPSFGHFDGNDFSVIDFDGNTLASASWNNA